MRTPALTACTESVSPPRETICSCSFRKRTLFYPLDLDNQNKTRKRIFTSPVVNVNEIGKLPPQAVDLEEAAALDGAGRLQTLRLIILPVAVPGLIAAGVLVFLESWSEFFFALVLTDSYTVPPLLAGFLSMQTFNWTLLSAATVIAIIPPVLLTMVFQKYIVTALASGTGK
jgi:ABC-type spermidine/putrescine transport system permease subunit II